MKTISAAIAAAVLATAFVPATASAAGLTHFGKVEKAAQTEATKAGYYGGYYHGYPRYRRHYYGYGYYNNYYGGYGY